VTIQQDLKSNNLSLNEAIDVAQKYWIVHSGDWRLRLALHTPIGACQERRRRRIQWITVRLIHMFEIMNVNAESTDGRMALYVRVTGSGD